MNFNWLSFTPSGRLLRPSTMFQDSHDRDVIFALGRAVDEPIELGFHEWDLNRSRVREIIPYYVKLCLEGIPHHVWCKEIAKK
jgi:hypothetical protein